MSIDKCLYVWYNIFRKEEKVINISNQFKNDDFYQTAVYNLLKDLLPHDEAKYLTSALVKKRTKEELSSFLLSPIIVVNGEQCEQVDNNFIKRQLLKKGNYDALNKINEAKIIICNCTDIAIIGLDVVYLFDNKVRFISPKEQAKIKNEVFLAKNNKVLHSVNITYQLSVGNAFKNVIHNAFDRVINTRMLNISPTTVIEYDGKEMLTKVKRSFEKSKDGNTYTIYNPQDGEPQNLLETVNADK